MPRLSDLLRRPSGINDHREALPLPQPMQPTGVPLGHNLPADPQPPVANPIIRCPMPATGTVNPDSLRQFYSSNAPKFRVLTQK